MTRALDRFALWCAVWLGLAMPAAAHAQSPQVLGATALAFDAAGNLYLADAKAHRVFEATLGGSLQVIAGTGAQGFAGDGGPAIAAELNQPQGIAVGPDGIIYVADTGNQRIRAIDAGGTITTYAGSGMVGFSGDGNAAVRAALRGPTALAVDGVGRLLLCDTGNHRLRAVTAGVISTLAGSGVQGFSGDGGPAVAAALDSPGGLAVDGTGRIYLADSHNHRIRVVDTAGMISTYAGTGDPGFAGDSGQATKAQFARPRGLASMPDGTLLVADTGNRRVRRIAANGIVTTLAGNGVQGRAADASAASGAMLESPGAVAVSTFGFPVLADVAGASGGSVSVVAQDQVMYRPAALAPGRVPTQIATATAITASYGQGALAAAITGSAGKPQGQVQVLEAGVVIASTVLQAGAAQLDLSALPAGQHALTIAYLGDGLNPEATLAVQASVTPATATATALPANVAYGAPLPLLTGALEGVLPGDVQQVRAVFQAEVSGLPPVGTYPIKAVLTGTKAGNYTLLSAANAGQLTVTRASAKPALAAVAQAFTGVPLTLSATVASGTQGQPTGTVQFLDGNTVVASGTLQAGRASAVYAAPQGGSRQLSVQYMGDSNFLTNRSPMVEVPVSALPDFSVTSGGSQTASVHLGDTASFAVLVSAQPGPFTGAVAISAAGMPSGALVVCSPAQVVPGTGSATVSVTVQVPATAAALTGGHAGEIRTCSAIALVLICRKRRRRPTLVGVCLAGVATACTLLPLAGCGARSVGEGLEGVAAKTYTVQITGTATNLAGKTVVHSVPLTLTVQQ